jgi:hypothetical protein
MNTNSLNNKTSEKSNPANGAVMASLLAAGIASAALGLFTTLVEASPHFFKVKMNFFNPVGPLSGITILSVAVYFLAWLGLNRIFDGKTVDEKKWTLYVFFFLGLGFLFTFPPVYQLFTSPT